MRGKQYQNYDFLAQIKGLAFTSIKITKRLGKIRSHYHQPWYVWVNKYLTLKGIICFHIRPFTTARGGWGCSENGTIGYLFQLFLFGNN